MKQQLGPACAVLAGIVLAAAIASAGYQPGARRGALDAPDGPRSGAIPVLAPFKLPQRAGAPEIARQVEQLVTQWMQQYRDEHDLDYAAWSYSTLSPLPDGRAVFALPPDRQRTREEDRVRSYEYAPPLAVVLWRCEGGEWVQHDMQLSGVPDGRASSSQFLVCVEPRRRLFASDVVMFDQGRPVRVEVPAGLYGLRVSDAGAWIGYEDGRRIGGLIREGRMERTFDGVPPEGPVEDGGDRERFTVVWLDEGRRALLAHGAVVTLPDGLKEAGPADFGRLALGGQLARDNRVVAYRDGVYVLHTIGPKGAVVGTTEVKLQSKQDVIYSRSPDGASFAVRTYGPLDVLPGAWSTLIGTIEDGRFVPAWKPDSQVVGWLMIPEHDEDHGRHASAE